MWEACTAAGTDWWLCWWRWALLRAVCVLTACLHAPRSSLDFNRAFISKWMTLNWSGKYTGCLLIIGRVYFFQPLLVLAQTDQYIKSIHARPTYRTGRPTLVRPMLTITVMSSEWQTIQSLPCTRFKSRASAVNKGLWHRILGHIVSFLSTVLSLYLPQPPTTYFSLFFNPLQLVPWHC